MKKILLLLLSITILSCSKKEIKVPVLAYEGIQELHNHSQVWMFFEIKNNDTIAVLNRKNTISTTHWIYNIDKKLPLKAIIPLIKKLTYKHANGVHSKEGMYNYFSYSDTISKKLSFIKFDDIEYKTDSLLSKHYIKENAKDYSNFNNINITINTNNNWINDGKFEKKDFKKLLTEFINFSAEGKQTMLHINYNQNISYQKYLQNTALFKSISNEAILISPIEFIFNQTKVPDCGCE